MFITDPICPSFSVKIQSKMLKIPKLCKIRIVPLLSAKFCLKIVFLIEDESLNINFVSK